MPRQRTFDHDECRQLREQGSTYRDLAERYGVGAGWVERRMRPQENGAGTVVIMMRGNEPARAIECGGARTRYSEGHTHTGLCQIVLAE